MDELSERILDSALELAERDGYDAVRIREVAEKADVALGTLYRRFASKEDILAGLLERESSRVEALLHENPLPGATAAERLDGFFTLATMALVMRPKLARALLRTVASGEPELAGKVMRFHGLITRIIVDILHGKDEPAQPGDVTVAHFLQQIWFGGLVGWAGGLHPPEVIQSQMRDAARVLLAGQPALAQA